MGNDLSALIFILADLNKAMHVPTFECSIHEDNWLL